MNEHGDTRAIVQSAMENKADTQPKNELKSSIKTVLSDADFSNTSQLKSVRIKVRKMSTDKALTKKTFKSLKFEDQGSTLSNSKKSRPLRQLS